MSAGTHSQTGLTHKYTHARTYVYTDKGNVSATWERTDYESQASLCDVRLSFCSLGSAAGPLCGRAGDVSVINSRPVGWPEILEANRNPHEARAACSRGPFQDVQACGSASQIESLQNKERENIKACFYSSPLANTCPLESSPSFYS